MPDFVLQPLPDEEDDLIRHYASPKHYWDPLPLDLFPRPDPTAEQFQSSIFPCFKYYDLGKYTEEEARQLSAMDLIPKDALKKQDENQHRAKRLKRTTTESANIAGYYRYKNEGVEMLYREKDVVVPKFGLRAKKAQISQQKNMDSGTIFSSILKAPKLSSQSRNDKPTAKKQGNRMEFLAGLRQNMLKPNSKSSKYPVLSSIPALPVHLPRSTMRPARNLAPNLSMLLPSPIPIRDYEDDEENETSESGSSSFPSPLKYGAPRKQMKTLDKGGKRADVENQERKRLHRSQKRASNAGGNDEESSQSSSGPSVDDQPTENGGVEPAWNDAEELNTSSNKDFSIEVLAHEELGASDDEELLGFPHFKPLV